MTAGDDSLTGAVRELAEELGIVVRPQDLQYLITWRSRTRPAPDFINNSFSDLYLLRTDLALTDFTMQTEEISELKYMPISELYRLVQCGDPSLVPHPEAYAQLFSLFPPDPDHNS